MTPFGRVRVAEGIVEGPARSRPQAHQRSLKYREEYPIQNWRSDTARKGLARLIATAVCVACVACGGKTPTAPPTAVLEISSATVSTQRLGPGTRYTTVFEIRETGGADVVLDRVDLEYSADNWVDLAHYKVADAFAADRLKALGSLKSGDLGWTSSSSYRSVKISVGWSDSHLNSGIATRVVDIPAR